MSLVRKFDSGFFKRWKSLPDDEKCSDREFQNLSGDLSNGSLSMYSGNGSEKFAIEVAAANTISRKSVQDVDMVVLHASPCINIISNIGRTGITHIDRAHVNAGGISMDELCKIFKDTSTTTIYEIDESQIYPVLSTWWKESNNYKDLFRQ